MNPKPRIPWQKRRRINSMLWAYLTFYSRKLPVTDRETQCWVYLLEWARLGGKSDEVVGA